MCIPFIFLPSDHHSRSLKPADTSASAKMGFPNDGGVVTICAYAKSKFEERVEQKRRKRSSSAPGADRKHGYGKLHKPPSVKSLHERPRNRLRKTVTMPSLSRPTTDLFVLEYEPYPYNTRPSEFLGVYSTIDSVTLAAFKHGAYTFSREGLLDGSEYLSPSGRIKIVPLAMQRSGAKATVTERSQGPDGRPVRLDIPHPGDHTPVLPRIEGKEMAYLAIRKGPSTASCIGVFMDKSLAWGACLKDKTMCATTFILCDEERSIALHNMPQVSGRLVGSGRHIWLVEQHAIDGPGRPPTTVKQQ